MAFVLGDHDEGTTASAVDNVVLSLTGTAVNSQIVVAVYWYDPGATITISSITCSGESNLTVHEDPIVDTGSGHNFLQISSLANNTGGGDKTITVTMSAAPGSGALHAKATEFTGGDVTGFFDKSASAYGTFGGSTSASTSITTAGANSLIYVAGSSAYVGVTYTPGANYTELSDVGPANLGSTYAEYDLDAGVAGSKTADFTLSETDDWMLHAVALYATGQAPAAAANGPHSMLMTHQRYLRVANA